MKVLDASVDWGAANASSLLKSLHWWGWFIPPPTKKKRTRMPSSSSSYKLCLGISTYALVLKHETEQPLCKKWISCNLLTYRNSKVPQNPPFIAIPAKALFKLRVFCKIGFLLRVNLRGKGRDCRHISTKGLNSHNMRLSPITNTDLENGVFLLNFRVKLFLWWTLSSLQPAWIWNYYVRI